MYIAEQTWYVNKGWPITLHSAICTRNSAFFAVVYDIIHCILCQGYISSFLSLQNLLPELAVKIFREHYYPPLTKNRRSLFPAEEVEE
jgi:hypothetical protein